MPDVFTHIGLTHYVVVATLLFSIGLFGVMSSRNVIRALMALELMLAAVNINLVAFNNYLQPINPSTGAILLSGQVFAIFVLTVSAVEAAVGLAIVIALYRQRATVDLRKFNILKW